MQSAAPAHACRQQDREFWRRTIDRVKQLTVENSQLWRLEEARWLLTGDLGEKEQASVLATLTELAQRADSAEPHRLLAIAHERSAASATPQGQAAAMRLAAEEMAKASRPAAGGRRDRRRAGAAAAPRGPRRRGVTLPRPRRGRADARRATSGCGWRTCTRSRGRRKKAIDLASPLGAEAAPRLARWYRAMGQPQKAVDLYAKLLDAPDLDAQTVLDAASFLAGQGKAEQAEKFLARLDTLRGLEPGAKELVRAKFAERHRPDEATAWYERAAEAQGASAGVWRELAGHHLRHRRFGEAVAAAARGLDKFPQDADLQAMEARAHELGPLARGPVGRVGGRAAPGLPVVRPAERAGQRDADDPAPLPRAGKRRPRGGGGVGGGDAAGGGQVPEFPAAAGGRRARAPARGEPQKAEAVARRAVSSFPDDVEAVRLVAAVYAAMGRWTELREAATTWRRLTPDQPLEPDMLVARAS